jgi:hypothetical protein
LKIHFNIVVCRLKAGISKSKQVSTASQRLGKRVRAVKSAIDR